MSFARGYRCRQLDTLGLLSILGLDPAALHLSHEACSRAHVSHAKTQANALPPNEHLVITSAVRVPRKYILMKPSVL